MAVVTRTRPPEGAMWLSLAKPLNPSGEDTAAGVGCGQTCSLKDDVIVPVGLDAWSGLD